MHTHATPDATEGHATEADLAEVGYARLGRTALVTSRLGVGTYRMDDRVPEHAEALTAALLQGVNLVDTSTNYTDGHAEQLIGKVLAKLFEAGKLSRDQVIVVSKAGYVQGENLQRARDRDAAGSPIPEMVHFLEDCWHCLHPEFLADQLGRSLARLGLRRLDVYLLHNPEYFLSDARKHRPTTPLAEVRAQFYERVKRAFARLEEECDAGRLSFYGVSSNSFGAPAAEPDATSLTRMLELAREVAKERTGDPERHRFAVVQLPLNLLEGYPALIAKDGPAADRTVLAYAAEQGLAVLANRPLNAFVGERLVRLAEPPARAAQVPLQEAASEVQALEAIFAEDFAPQIKVEGKGPRPEQIFRWGKELADPRRFTGLDHWLQLQGQVIGPEVNGALRALGQGFGEAPAFRAWAVRYGDAMTVLLESVTYEVLAAARRQASELKQKLSPLVPGSWKPASLSRQALATLLSTEGVTAVLVGMRKRAYVEDALGAVGLSPLEPGQARKVFEALARRR